MPFLRVFNFVRYCEVPKRDTSQEALRQVEQITVLVGSDYGFYLVA